MKVHFEISDRHKSRVEVHFPYNPNAVILIKEIAGARFVGREKGGPYWTLPLDVQVMREARRLFGKAMVLGPRLVEWGREQVRTENKLSRMASARDASLRRAPDVIPDTIETLRDYQRVGAAFIAQGRSVLLADHPGLGKTRQAIVAIYEAGIDQGSHLVVAPKSGLFTVWQKEIEELATGEVFIAPESGRKAREKMVQEFIDCPAETKWLVVNPAMVRMKKEKVYDAQGDPKLDKNFNEVVRLTPVFPEIHNIEWNSITLDEISHRSGASIKNPTTLTAKAIYSLNLKDNALRIAMSGTPMTNRPIDLWGILHWLDPDRYSSKWDWANRYLTVTDNGFGKKIGGVDPNREEDLWESLTPYVLRRTKPEVAKELPLKNIIDRWVPFGSKKHEKQYREMAAEAQVRIGDENVSATSVLAELTRLKQFADARYEESREGKRIRPTTDSGKFDELLEILEERGILDDEGDSKVVVFSQFSQVVESWATALRDTEKVDVATLTGSTTKKGERQRIQDAFQGDGGPRVLFMTTTAGGVSITLDRADTVVIVDETWSPTEQEQAEDRVHRISRIHPVDVYYLRTEGTVEEYIMEQVADKAEIHKRILDVRRGLRLA